MKLAFLTQARPEMLARIPKDMPHVVVFAGPDGQYSPEALAKVADVDALVVAAEPVHEQLLAACKRLKIVQRLGVGYNTLDLAAIGKRGIPACNVAGVNKEAVAEHGMTLICALAKRLREADAITREANWAGSRLLTKTTFELNGKTLGIVGFGDTGTNLARRARAFGMKIVYNDIRTIDPQVVAEYGATFMEKDDLFAKSDVVSVSVDLNDSSRGMVDARRLRLMKRGAIFVCCARGNIVDEAALRDVLVDGHLHGAGIDVFSHEPLHPDNPLLTAPNCLMTAHVAGVVPEASERSWSRAMENMRRVVGLGEKPQWVLNGV